MHINIHPGESKPLRDDKFNDRNTVISFAISTMIEVYERKKEPLTIVLKYLPDLSVVNFRIIWHSQARSLIIVMQLDLTEDLFASKMRSLRGPRSLRGS